MSIDSLRSGYQFLLCGFGCEYSLTALARYLGNDGYKVITVDMQETPLPAVIDGPHILVTSQHPACSSQVFQAHWGEDFPFNQYVAPLEIMQRFRPACSVFIPHDLEMPIRPEELIYMNAFDLYGAPAGPVNPALRHYCKVIETGWIKHNGLDRLAPDVEAMVAERGVIFINQIVQLMRSGGASYLLASYPQILAKGLPLKLPEWPGCDSLAAELVARGAHVLPASLSSTALIASSRSVFVNSPGSVVAEARYLGVQAVILDPDMQNPSGAGEFASNAAAPPFNFPLLLESIDQLLGAHR
ncbi:hypothetical protein [Candidatus Accumulibacter sp. ACC003]|uniref:hypothetical protein n=1 Tax=Candidatus Accumulibacter sp. ACC003 TaxID=2823334 RepID=UPI0025BD72A9|nr:hypothetical protein [Candidatus Accumulibacter sp. ACC003]